MNKQTMIERIQTDPVCQQPVLIHPTSNYLRSATWMDERGLSYINCCIVYEAVIKNASTKYVS